jgi:hypothetical protein
MLRILAFGILVGTVATALGAPSVARPVDPGVRGGPASAGGALPGLTSDEAQFFQDGLTRFQDVEVFTGGEQQWTGAALQLQPVFVLRLAARRRRDQP